MCLYLIAICAGVFAHVKYLSREIYDLTLLSLHGPLRGWIQENSSCSFLGFKLYPYQIGSKFNDLAMNINQNYRQILTFIILLVLRASSAGDDWPSNNCLGDLLLII